MNVTRFLRLTAVLTIMISSAAAFMAGTANAVVTSCTITNPLNNATYNKGDYISLEGSAIDATDGTLFGDSLVWTSTKNGPLGTGTPLGVNNLETGEHEIRLTATGSDGTTLSDSITLTIQNTAPVATIEEPSDGDSFTSSNFITFTGKGEDDQDGLLEDQYLIWTSSLDGKIGEGSTFDTDALSIGAHQIFLTVTDTEGLAANTSINITITNTPPTATISKPADGSVFTTGNYITFEGFGTDAEDGTITGSTLVWSSDLDGRLGTGTPLTLNTLTPGNHTITLTVTDNDNTSGSATISITLTNATPAVTISSPSDGAAFNEEESITFSGTAVDPEDGPLTGSSLVWTSHRDGKIGEGSSITTSSLSKGAHTITLTATDSDGESGSASIAITAGNTAPVATIITPQDNDKYLTGDDITFHGRGEDAEDGILPDASLQWTSSRGDVLPSGGSFTRNDLKDGIHVITLTVTDKEGSTGTASVTITCGNTPPSVTIHNPATGASFDEGQPVTLYGTGTDAEDGNLTDSSFEWTSNNNGVITALGTGMSLTTRDLETGTHTITLTGTDKDDASDSKSITLNVVPMTTTPSSLYLAGGSSATIVINGGTPPYELFTRHSSVAAPFFDANTNIIITGRDEGETTVKVTDSDKNASSINVIVSSTGNAAPVADARSSESSAVEGSTVTLDGSYSYDNDTGDKIISYHWRQLLAGGSGTQAVISAPDNAKTSFIAPPVNLNTTLWFELKVTDSSGKEDTDTVGVMVTESDIADFPDNVIPYESSTGKNIGIKNSGTLQSVSMISSDAVSDTSGKPSDFIYGLVDFTIKVTAAGEMGQIVIYLPEPAPEGYKWYKYSALKGWTDFDRQLVSNGTGDGAVFSSDRKQVTLYITDGGEFDDDSTAMVIADPSGLAAMPGDSGGGGGGGGCFIDTLVF